MLIREGEYARSAYFIERGMTRSFWMVDGEEFTTSFSIEGGIVFSMDELYYGRPSEEYVETLEEVTAYRIALDVWCACSRPTSSWPTGGVSSIRTSTAGSTSPTRRGSHCLPGSVTRLSAVSFPKCAGGRD